MSELIKENILKRAQTSGSIEEQDVNSLYDVFVEDKIISTDEVEYLFELNNAIQDKSTTGYCELFVDTITFYVLKSGETENSISLTEWEWLKNHISTDEKLDSVELDLLINLVSKADFVPHDLLEMPNYFEREMEIKKSKMSVSQMDNHFSLIENFKSALDKASD